MANSNQMSLFDMFEDFGASPVEEKKEEAPKKSVVTPSVTAEAEDTESDDAAVEETTTEEKKPAAPKTTTKSKGTKKLTGPVRVVGTGWEFNFGEIGKSYEPKEVIKAAFNEGFKEVALATLTIPKDGGVIYVDSISHANSSDSTAVNGDVTVILARKAANYTAEDFPGLDADEVSLFDVLGKFVEASPEFKGCGLYFSFGIAVPVFENKYALKKDSDGIVKIWKEDGIREYKEAEAALLYSEDVSFYKSEADVLFPSYRATGKGVTNVYMTYTDFGLENRVTGDVAEKYALPVMLYLETFGQRKELTEADFEGKKKITREELIDWLKPRYRVFQSANRKFDVLYEKAQNIVSVAVISGEKGAADSAVSKRIEDTDIGVFAGDFVEGEVSNLTFSSKLPKIPISILENIIKEFRRTKEVENMVQIYWDGTGYYLKKPEMTVSKVRVDYRMTHTSDTLVMSVHSHNTMPAVFSSTDNADEIYTGLFGVIGNIDREMPTVSFRAGMEGCFTEVSVTELFR